MGLNLKQFDGGFKPQAGRASDLEKVPDGEYTVEFGAPEIKDLKEGVILKMPCTIVGGPQDGSSFKHDIWLNKQEACDSFGKDLEKLGFDAAEWNAEHDRSFSDELEKALKVLPGMRAIVTKKTNKSSDGRVFHNLYIKGRGEGDGAPAKIDAAYLDEQSADAFS